MSVSRNIVSKLLAQLRRSSFLAIECPCCTEKIKTAKADLFTEDSLSRRAQKFLSETKEQIDSLREEIADIRDHKPKRIANTVRSVNIGKMVERFAPILDGFGFEPRDCRALFYPIDYVVFEGRCSNRIDSIYFLDVKTGKADLADRQKQIKRAVDADRVTFEYLD